MGMEINPLKLKHPLQFETFEFFVVEFYYIRIAH